MATIISNRRVAEGIYVMHAKGRFEAKAGQFFMVRGWENYPLLSRPLSVYDQDEQGVKFLYKVAGEGTERLARMKAGDEVTLLGPLGNGFPAVHGRTALVGGGIGIAPLYYTARQLEQADLYLGFSAEVYEEHEFRSLRHPVEIDLGGIVLDRVDFDAYDTIFVCGPEPMLRAAQMKSAMSSGRANVYVSLENRMACGIGACLVCSVGCENGRKKACSDGPVFRAEEVVLA
ncbi:dihydroorotate dehydrogenase electron transfer subunit [Saccharibacillus alkalitolerans]|uniref:Dihydroorotate dehydrogenase electron transfer subunit n=1 Tax=Saccharibacillus alkalitolerans TaxID=2705290 RepID=A0ABX0F261_9BACL|nr:dihydroorotate dehydrogenase electron transfer subunit [Saccharibacillus alkalitolerans]NGZ74530.1 dihydroorotate dehydrogenase electron transfer subunit [Saccharibacillus alkalitolerans]